MSDYTLTIENHPAQARHPITGKPLFRAGVPVPLFPDERSVRLDGVVIAYVSDKKNVLFIVPESRLGPIAAEAVALVERELGPVKKTTSVTEVEPDDDGEWEDEYE